MRELTADLLVGRLVDWGVDTVFGLPADSADGVVEAFRRLGDQIRLVLVHHEEAAALMAAGYAKVDRAGRGLPGHLRPGGAAAAGRPVRRQARPPAGPGHHREPGDPAARHQLPAGAGPGDGVRRRRRLQRPGQRARADPGRGRHRDRPRPGPGHGLPHHLPAGPGGHRGRDQPVDADHPDRDPANGPAVHRRPRGPARRRPAPGGRRAQPGQPGRPAGRGGRPGGQGGAAGGGRRGRRAGGQVPARQGGCPRRPPVHHRLHRRARDPAVRAGPGRRRHPPAGRDQLPVGGQRARPCSGQGRPDRDRPGPAWAAPAPPR